MSESTSKQRKSRRNAASANGLRRLLRRWFWRGLLGMVVLTLVWILLLSFIRPPAGLYIRSESYRLGGVEREWASWDEIAPVMARSIVAAEDANYCLHWGFDMGAIRDRLERGGSGGASTLSQQVVKNVFLWHGRSWVRKALEAMLTPVIETLWSKQRILEVYMNIAEFDEGVFGVKAAAKHYFNVTPDKLTATQAARLAMVLPSPKQRSASKPTQAQRNRTARIMDGAQTIAVDGRASCFQ